MEKQHSCCGVDPKTTPSQASKVCRKHGIWQEVLNGMQGGTTIHMLSKMA